MRPIDLVGPGLVALAISAFLGTGVDARSVRLRSDTETGWTAYIAATDVRRAGEASRPDRFLAMAASPDAARHLHRVQSGAIVVEPVVTAARDGRTLTVPAAAVHHWRGAVFVPGATIAGIMHTLYTGPPLRTDDVLVASVLERRPDWLRVYLKVQRRKFVTATYHTEHVVAFRHHGASRAETSSVATRIAELDDVGTSGEHERPAGEDRGFLWRLNAYWRYEAVPGGVMAECESVTLSRPVPFVLRPAVAPLVDRTARESMERTLTAFRDAFSPEATGRTPRAWSPVR